MTNLMLGNYFYFVLPPNPHPKFPYSSRLPIGAFQALKTDPIGTFQGPKKYRPIGAFKGPKTTTTGAVQGPKTLLEHFKTLKITTQLEHFRALECSNRSIANVRRCWLAMPLGAGLLSWLLACHTIEKKTKVWFLCWHALQGPNTAMIGVFQGP